MRWARTDFAGWQDVRLLEIAEAEERVVFTLDKDFWQIALQRRTPLVRSGVILLRVHPATPETILPVARGLVNAECEWAGHVCIVDETGIQMVAARGR